MACLEPGSREGLVEITSRAWELLAGCSAAPVLEVRARPVAMASLSAEPFTFRVTGISAGTANCAVKPSTRIRKLLSAIFDRYDLHAHEWRAMLGPEDLADSADLTVGEFGLRSDDAVHFIPKEAGA
ncbi:hypothetical protein AURDEDRAFT_162407 [Auricularia subglabra TFB-10046 SS5]|nr:hypothetical protein AURDEDRAFT_162407 [Auricularia subglabra TFB-10046 SS5]